MARPAELTLDLLARLLQLCVERRRVEGGKARMGAGVRADLPAGLSEPIELLP